VAFLTKMPHSGEPAQELALDLPSQALRRLATVARAQLLQPKLAHLATQPSQFIALGRG